MMFTVLRPLHDSNQITFAVALMQLYVSMYEMFLEYCIIFLIFMPCCIPFFGITLDLRLWQGFVLVVFFDYRHQSVRFCRFFHYFCSKKTKALQTY